MRLTRKNLCWFLVMVMMFCAVCSGGCGGSSSSGGSGGGGSEDVYVPDNPSTESDDTPAPAPDSDTGGNTSGNINGTWQVATSTFYYDDGEDTFTANYISGSASAKNFTVAVSKNADNTYYTIALSGEGVQQSDEDYYDSLVTCDFSSSAVPVPIEGIEVIAGTKTYEQTAANVYTFTREHMQDGELGEYTLVCRIQLVDSSTMTCHLEGKNGTVDTTFKRVN